MYYVSLPYSKYWNTQNSEPLEFVLKLLGYTFEANGIECGYIKGDRVYWFYDDGTIGYSGP